MYMLCHTDRGAVYYYTLLVRLYDVGRYWAPADLHCPCLPKIPTSPRCMRRNLAERTLASPGRLQSTLWGIGAGSRREWEENRGTRWSHRLIGALQTEVLGVFICDRNAGC